ncbi:MAG: hypothetical protein NTU61_00065 [Candidatus Altiarchaeota archaeon]|nr:hypothetical protein [Candidatus Altiarchaeota archaeon]
MFKKGQSAMEYLMTYGWAIMVVMVAGIALWRLGILNVGSSIPTTSEGFQAIKPMLSSCELTGDYDGQACEDAGERRHGCLGVFKCTFVNAAGAPIRLKRISVSTVPGRYCDQRGKFFISKTGQFDVAADGGCARGKATGTCLYSQDSTGFHNYYAVDKDGMFVIQVMGCPPRPPDVNPDDCYNYDGPIAPVGTPFEAEVDIEYEITIGGTKGTKHSVGTVRGSRTQWSGYPIKRVFNR